MGFDMQMVEPPTPAEVAKHKLDAKDPGYFRYNVGAMSVMVMVMTDAGVLDGDEDEPAFPKWPPPGTPADRVELMRAAGSDKTAEAKLTPAERATLAKAQAQARDVRHTHSKRAGVVPTYKFEVNDGFIVDPGEASLVASKLRAYATRVDATVLARLDKAYADRQAQIDRAVRAQMGSNAVTIGGNQPLGMTMAQLKTWIDEWATYNELAAKHKGYEID